MQVNLMSYPYLFPCLRSRLNSLFSVVDSFGQRLMPLLVQD